MKQKKLWTDDGKPVVMGDTVWSADSELSSHTVWDVGFGPFIPDVKYGDFYSSREVARKARILYLKSQVARHKRELEKLEAEDGRIEASA